ncbi:YciI family protein [Thermomonospora umbrina]|uniref:YCII-related domain-containing protein n=1 Tax=Thermomonospora umbrina TaxID=111806 RepID=A0A3D9SPF6_9ACTN|nr:YciI family protein [Thermomonospora umbrina]REE97856.1 hypothetical protein DFJ69_3331 [Thermomonospora umbrina]
MRYLLLIGADEEQAEQAMAEGRFAGFSAWLDDLERRGVLRAHEGLRPSPSARTVRVRGDAVVVTDGPFIEGREQIGGFALVECRDLDEAIEIAAGHPAAAIGRVEIRPVVG